MIQQLKLSDHIDSKDCVWAISEDRRRTTVYPSFEDFREESSYSPQNLDTGGFNVEADGMIFQKYRNNMM